MTQGPLQKTKILDLTDERGIYGAKILADLGADVIRPEPVSGDPLRNRGPFIENDDGSKQSIWHAFFCSSRRSIALDLESKVGKDQLTLMLKKVDVLLTCPNSFGVSESSEVLKHEKREDLVIIDTCSFRPNCEWSEYLAPDIVAGALGGQLATTGDADTPPLKNFGELNFMVSGAYTAIAALAALYHRRETDVGQEVEVSVHESIASCLEHVFMFYWYAEIFDRPEGNVLPRRGSLHWSDAYDVMNAKNGSIMVTPTPDFDKQLSWMIEEDIHDDLIDPKYLEPENLKLRIDKTMSQLRQWVSKQDAEELFFAAQDRHMPYGWVLPIEKVAENPQLVAREWFTPYQIASHRPLSTGAPYHFSDTPWELKDYKLMGDDQDEILKEIGWES